jgi:integrase
MGKRRGHGEGSVFRRKDCTWCGVLTIGYDGTGKRRRRYVYGATKAETLEKLMRLQHAKLTGELGEPTRFTVAAYLRHWLETAARPAIREATHLLYADLIRLHINTRIGGVALTKLTPAHVQELLVEMEHAGSSARLRQIVYGVLHKALKQALLWNLVPRNVCEAVIRPRVPEYVAKVLTKEQCETLLQSAKGERLEALYVSAITTGLREGELFGLVWPNVNLKDGWLQVTRQLANHAGHPSLAELKTASSRRKIILPAFAVASLREHRQRALVEGTYYNAMELVFTDTDGKPLRKSNFLRRTFYPFLKQAGLPRIRFHDLRHTAATLRLQQGDHPKVVQELLGHSRVSVTLDTYSHVMPSLQEESAAKIDRLFGYGG